MKELRIRENDKSRTFECEVLNEHEILKHFKKMYQDYTLSLR